MIPDAHDIFNTYRTLHILPQKPSPAPVSDDMKAVIQSSPPLGQITQVKGGNIVFTVVLQVPSSRQDEPWQVALWHSSDDAEWSEALLEVASEAVSPRNIQSASDQLAYLFYTATLEVHRSLQFTLKFRHGEQEPWRWTRDELGMGDGHVFVDCTPASQLSPDISQLIKDLNPAWQSKSLLSQAPRTRLWSLTTEVAAAVDDHSTIDDIPIGVPWGQYLR